MDSMLQELMNDMRWRRDTEYKLLTVHVAIITASVILLFHTEEKSFLIEILAKVIALVLATLSCKLITAKIEKENETYQYLGKIVVRIWEDNKYFDPADQKPPLLGEESRNYGKGGGFEYAKKLINYSTIGLFFVILILIVAEIQPYLAT